MASPRAAAVASGRSGARTSTKPARVSMTASHQCRRARPQQELDRFGGQPYRYLFDPWTAGSRDSKRRSLRTSSTASATSRPASWRRWSLLGKDQAAVWVVPTSTAAGARIKLPRVDSRARNRTTHRPGPHGAEAGLIASLEKVTTVPMGRADNGDMCGQRLVLALSVTVAPRCPSGSLSSGWRQVDADKRTTEMPVLTIRITE